MLSFNFLETIYLNRKEIGLADALSSQKHFFYQTTVLTTDRLNSKLSLSSFSHVALTSVSTSPMTSSRRRFLPLIFKSRKCCKPPRFYKNRTCLTLNETTVEIWGTRIRLWWMLLKLCGGLTVVYFCCSLSLLCVLGICAFRSLAALSKEKIWAE